MHELSARTCVRNSTTLSLVIKQEGFRGLCQAARICPWPAYDCVYRVHGQVVDACLAAAAQAGRDPGMLQSVLGTLRCVLRLPACLLCGQARAWLLAWRWYSGSTCTAPAVLCFFPL